jgi:hypothetical protein
MADLSKCIGMVSVLLDYYPSAQFACLHVANRLGLFRKKGLELNLLLPANVLIPVVARGVQSKAFATIFQRSPLALAALPGTKLGSGADLQSGSACTLTRLSSCGPSAARAKGARSYFKQGRCDSDLRLHGAYADAHHVHHSSAHKHTLLCSLSMRFRSMTDCMVSTQIHAIKHALFCAHTNVRMRAHTQEAMELRNLLQEEASVMRLEDMSAQAQRAIPLGFSQVLFEAKWALRKPKARGALLAFLEASDQGWRPALADPRAAAAMVVEDRPNLAR